MNSCACSRFIPVGFEDLFDDIGRRFPPDKVDQFDPPPPAFDEITTDHPFQGVIPPLDEDVGTEEFNQLIRGCFVKEDDIVNAA